jgi:hypothetical protein
LIIRGRAVILVLQISVRSALCLRRRPAGTSLQSQIGVTAIVAPAVSNREYGQIFDAL